MDVPAWKRGLQLLQMTKQNIPAAVHSIVLPQRLVDITSIRQQLLSQYDLIQSRIKDLKKAADNEVPGMVIADLCVVLGSFISIIERLHRCEVYNLGTGKATSVLEMVAAFEKASGKKIPLVHAARRPGDAEIVYAETDKAERELKRRAKYGIDEMCVDQWNWASKNPYGYEATK